MSLLQNIWDIGVVNPNADVLTKLFANRGITTLSERDSFLMEDPYAYIHDPFLMAGIDKGCERIWRAIADKERIVVFGDYDADGITATAVLVRCLKKLGAEVSYRIPHRIKDGYSLKDYFLDELHALDVKVVITVDNGIAAAREIAHANTLGMDIVVTDHHNPPEDLPEAYTIMNPKLKGCKYPYDELSGSAVALKFCDALCQQGIADTVERKRFLETLYQIASIGLVADCMPLTGENRAIVKIGLHAMNTAPISGIKALMDVSGIKEGSCTARDIAFLLGPRLNAAGRIESAYDSLHIFLKGSDEVKRIADFLHECNDRRRTMTAEFTDEAYELVEGEGTAHFINIVSSPNWNSGINGLVASRLVEAYSRPAIVLAEREDDLVASCRSIEGLDMYEALTECSDLLMHYGGHTLAAGFSIKKENFPVFKKKMEDIAKRELEQTPLKKHIEVACDISVSDMHWDLYAEILQLEPFGLGNPKPVFLVEDVVLSSLKQIGSGGAHLSFVIGNIKGVAFGCGHIIEDLEGASLQIVGTLEENHWNGRKYLQFIAKDFALSKVLKQALPQ